MSINSQCGNENLSPSAPDRQREIHALSLSPSPHLSSKKGELSRQRQCLVDHQGLVPYTAAWEQQRSLVEQRAKDASLDDVLLLLEHPPVYTLGQGANLEFLKFDPTGSNWEVHRVERGGEVTYHCPGQLVGYPILNLRYYRQDLHWYLRQLEEVLIQVLGVYGLQGDRVPGMTGVWVEGGKVAAIGIKVTRWITMHGFALNVCPDLSGFQRIIPCGIADKPVTSLAQFIPDITVEQVRHSFTTKFAEVFNVELI
ncbi:MAG TPA: lipoyl(octanoyl) transferase [Cyanobacteria bacterium UBA8803]|nr:lipoyl(octanoyl) transferase [Cyanobacteria bacterium UBA9273]HBL59114.1 lipoyl(octanoyl) transferase [Cyanobacteria bacterium UBA8803]